MVEASETVVERPEWVLAREVVEHGYVAFGDQITELAAEVLRLRELAEVKYESGFSGTTKLP